MTAVVSMTNLGRKTARTAAFCGLVLTAQMAFPQSGEASEYKFKADYRVSLSGVPIGEAHLAGTFKGRKYRLDGYGKLTGLAGALYEYTASASSAGRLNSGRAVPNAFSVNASDGKKSATVRMTMNKKGVGRLKINPKPTAYWLNHPNRVKVTDAHKKGTIDPVSALIVAGTGSAEQLDKRACQRTVPIFNGRERFNVKLEYREIRTISDKAIPGGRVLVCGAKYHAVAGHRTDRKEIKLAEKLDIELIMAPIDGSDLLVPYRVTIPTPLGAAVVQASALTTTGTLGKRSAALVD